MGCAFGSASDVNTCGKVMINGFRKLGSDEGHFVSVGIGENKERCRFVGVNGKEQSMEATVTMPIC